MTETAIDAVENLIKHIRLHYNDKDEIAFAYNEVRSQIIKELHYEDLSLVRMCRLLMQLYREDPVTLRLVLVVLSDPFVSFRSVAEQLGISSTTVWRRIQATAAKHAEIELLLNARKKDREQIRRKNGRFGRISQPTDGQMGQQASGTPPPTPEGAGPYPGEAGYEVERAGSTHRQISD